MVQDWMYYMGFPSIYSFHYDSNSYDNLKSYAYDDYNWICYLKQTAVNYRHTSDRHQSAFTP